MNPSTDVPLRTAMKKFFFKSELQVSDTVLFLFMIIFEDEIMSQPGLKAALLQYLLKTNDKNSSLCSR